MEGRMGGEKMEMRGLNNSFEDFLFEEEQRSGEMLKENSSSRETFFYRYEIIEHVGVAGNDNDDDDGLNGWKRGDSSIC